jgi:hypothetical protein
MTSPTHEPPGGDGDLQTLVHNYAQVIDNLIHLHSRLNTELIPQASRIAVGLSPVLIPGQGVITDPVTELLRRLATLNQGLGSLLLAWPIPIHMWRAAQEWVSVRHAASGVAGDLGVTNRDVQFRWQGAAADTYRDIVPAHVAAADRLATVADAAQYALSWAANAAGLFFAAVLGIVAGFLGSALIAVATGATGVGAPIAVLMLLILVGTVLTTMTSLFVGASQALGTAQTFMTEMMSEMADDGAFPAGQWPGARPELYNDATVTDGDPSDWSVRP